MTTTTLKATEYNDYFKRYIDLADTSKTLIENLVAGKTYVNDFFMSIPEDKQTYRYAEGKWSSKEILQHIIDTERIFMYRCFRISRHDETPLVGFDQDIYITPSKADHKTMNALLAEFDTIRDAFLSLIHSLTDEDLAFIGTASGSNMSARAAAFLVVGHAHWHIKIFKEHYL